MAEWVTDEWLSEDVRRAREMRVAERDVAAQQVLESRSLVEALGMADASEAEVGTRVRRLMRLLHPDYSINSALRGTKQQRRIEKAFKKLNSLRTACA